MSKETGEKKNKWLYPTIITILILMFLVLITYGLMLVTNLSVSYIEPELVESRTPVPQSNEELADYIDALIANVPVMKPKASYSWDVDIDDLEVSGAQSLKDTVSLVKENAEDFAGELGESVSVTYGEDPSALPLPSGITADDILSFDCYYIYYRCPACNNRASEPTDGCEKCGYDGSYFKQYEGNYSFTVELRDNDQMESTLLPVSESRITERLADGAKDFCSFDNAASQTESLTLRFSCRRVDDALVSLSIERTSKTTADLSFSGAYSALGACSAQAVVKDSVKFSFGYPSLNLSRHALSLDPKEKEQIVAERICDDPLSYPVTWTSSDESVATVDDRGYIKAGETPGEAVITASFDYQGKTYSDACEVKVKVSVEYISLNRRSMTLDVGETGTLKSRVAADKKGFDLKKPTIQTVKWFSTDESVATVDENGVVTAVSPGKCVVYALSDDASLDGYYYRSNCSVTVK